MSIFKASAKIIAAFPETSTLILDQTPFYPQGGGQPCDQGSIISKTGSEFKIKSVKKDPETGNILHQLQSFDQSLLLDSYVECTVDPNIRLLNTRCHSAGHLLDHAIEDLNEPLEVRGAYHFMPSPYVEYALADSLIELNEEYSTKLLARLKEAANKIVAEAIPVVVYNGQVSDLSDWRQELLPPSVKASGNVRLVKFCREGLLPVPCSGTHVLNSADIKPISIKKISMNKEKRTFRVTYVLE